jgi:hypothetical protein
MGKGVRVNGYGLGGVKEIGYRIIDYNLFDVFWERISWYEFHLFVILNKELYQYRREELQSKGLRVKGERVNGYGLGGMC